jgi:hypothetical protein
VWEWRGLHRPDHEAWNLPCFRRRELTFLPPRPACLISAGFGDTAIDLGNWHLFRSDRNSTLADLATRLDDFAGKAAGEPRPRFPLWQCNILMFWIYIYWIRNWQPLCLAKGIGVIWSNGPLENPWVWHPASASRATPSATADWRLREEGASIYGKEMRVSTVLDASTCWRHKCWRRLAMVRHVPFPLRCCHGSATPLQSWPWPIARGEDREGPQLAVKEPWWGGWKKSGLGQRK